MRDRAYCYGIITASRTPVCRRSDYVAGTVDRRTSQDQQAGDAIDLTGSLLEAANPPRPVLEWLGIRPG